ncbi:hypothetical protein L2E82_13305 [Cichorium intybus]|uniref:Uncharacterized protein n=1 Tax=Cichorium intybus TaxID=13427 RepID=A0ACB9EWM9_CICIN|nr:hypothetical protein L2E82_13305 [Cichorium intybus]
MSERENGTIHGSYSGWNPSGSKRGGGLVRYVRPSVSISSVSKLNDAVVKKSEVEVDGKRNTSETPNLMWWEVRDGRVDIESWGGEFDIKRNKPIVCGECGESGWNTNGIVMVMVVVVDEGNNRMA